METIFEFKPTKEEFHRVTSCDTKEFYLSYIDQDSAWADIATLMWLRRNEAAYKVYISKCSWQLQEGFWRTINHP